MDEGRPIFQQIAERVENDILSGALSEEGQVPSTNEFAMFYRINPATAGKGVNLLVEQGILYKRRGIGMFVAAGARERITARRRELFVLEYIAPMLAEAASLGIKPDQITQLIENQLSERETR
ncbi:GntR family transcriptional regulator [Cryobacterium sp. MP_3.1]|uniref:GntR family transcriptional regulator n=2 Tax=Microbacteriaceae TaxID=85023 RepID=A0A2S3ZNL7_9MICO|nr:MULTISPECIES: GntR family transcriptional regulator [Cryobacterium]MEC5184773.1 GntR family transcriptional regulator [Cryobacterium sp. MP_3.1]POH70044.1 GntR family transcriptional regulator [Cryobacterium zongtaii]POH70764.1 GntR family transcriptional regulator [Cryobacterium zongtaii]TFC43061.1 GntR family transcriptional regulator [Cryobacterium sp. TMN-39-2]